MGPNNFYKCDLKNSLVPLIMLSLNHQNHKQCPKWGHVHYNLPLFGDWWQHNQSNHKFAKIDKLNHLHLLGCLPPSNVDLGLPLKPWFPPLFLPLSCYFSLILTWSNFSPFGIYLSSLGKHLALIHISHPLESNHLKSLLQNNIAQENISSLGS